jgi:hypothetical protein
MFLLYTKKQVEILATTKTWRIEFDLWDTVKCCDDFFLKSSKAYEPYPCNVSGGNPQL